MNEAMKTKVKGTSLEKKAAPKAKGERSNGFDKGHEKNRRGDYRIFSKLK